MELDAERDADFQTWVKRLNAESVTLLKQISEFDFTESHDREMFYDLVEESEMRFNNLRNRNEIAEVPASVTIEIDRLLDRFDEVTQKRVIRVSAGDSQKEREKQRKQQQRGIVRNRSEKLAEQPETSTMRSRTTSSSHLFTRYYRIVTNTRRRRRSRLSPQTYLRQTDASTPTHRTDRHNPYERTRDSPETNSHSTTPDTGLPVGTTHSTPTIRTSPAASTRTPTSRVPSTTRKRSTSNRTGRRRRPAEHSSRASRRSGSIAPTHRTTAS